MWGQVTKLCKSNMSDSVVSLAEYLLLNKLQPFPLIKQINSKAPPPVVRAIGSTRSFNSLIIIIFCQDQKSHRRSASDGKLYLPLVPIFLEENIIFISLPKTIFRYSLFSLSVSSSK